MTALRLAILRRLLTAQERADVQLGLALLSDMYGAGGHDGARDAVDRLTADLDTRRIR